MNMTRRITRPLASLFVLALACLLIATSLAISAAPSADVQPALPLRAAFYYPWFPEAWRQQGISPYTKYTPALGWYNSSDPAIIRQHLAAMTYGGIQAGIASWWGQGSPTDQRIPALLAATAGDPFRWAIYYEQESQGDPSVGQISADLTYLRDHYGADPSYLRIGGRFVVFVYADAADGCGMADRWKQANTVNAYVVLKVFGGYASCASQPDGWHQYAPAVAADAQGAWSYSISPGFNKVGENPRLGRDLVRWQNSIRAMIASKAQFQLITTFNEWGEGTAVEPAAEWASASGYGAYLDALHNNGATSAPTQPSPTATGAPVQPSPTPTNAPAQPTATQPPVVNSTATGSLAVTADADARVEEANPTINYGASRYLQVDGASDPDRESYLHFTLSGVSGTIQSAKLRVYDTTNSTANGPAVYAVDNNWSERAITWNNRPARISSALDNKGAIGTQTWAEYNVTAAIKGDGAYSFALVADSTDGATFSSREDVMPPQLVLSFGTGTSSPTATPTAAPNQPTPTVAPTKLPTPTTAPASPTPPASGGHAIKNVFVILMENHNWADIKGSSAAPYINQTLLPQASYTQQYYNPPHLHPSEPNYIWLEAGTNFGITNDNGPSTNHQSTTNHLVTQLNKTGISWKAYQEDISGTVCPLSNVARYAPKHNPMIFFDDVTDTNNPNSAYCIAHERPYGELAGDLQNNTVARYNFITPNLCNDMHDCSISTGDSWLAREIPKIMNSAAYKNGGAIFITWDEGEGGDGPIGMIVLSPSAKGGGYSNTIHYTHSSTLRTIQEIFGVTPLLGDAANATDLRDLFKVFP